MDEIRNIFGGKNKPEVSISFKDAQNRSENFEKNLKSPNEISNKNEELSSDADFNSESRLKCDQIFGIGQPNPIMSSKSNKLARNNYIVPETSQNTKEDQQKTNSDCKNL